MTWINRVFLDRLPDLKSLIYSKNVSQYPSFIDIEYGFHLSKALSRHIVIRENDGILRN